MCRRSGKRAERSFYDPFAPQAFVPEDLAATTLGEAHGNHGGICSCECITNPMVIAPAVFRGSERPRS
jgi:hypothetical protein